MNGEIYLDGFRAMAKRNTQLNILTDEIPSLGVYFDKLNSSLSTKEPFWFRGLSNKSFDLTPSALRYKSKAKITKALNLLSDFKRYVELKIPKPPAEDGNDLKWVQLAQHYGLPTRLLDWTKNASVALYFACQEARDKRSRLLDGAVIFLNPINLNRQANPQKPQIYDAHLDKGVISQYFRDVEIFNFGLKTIAINPIWNSERITIQQGVFTLHGSNYTLDSEQSPGLGRIVIKNKFKKKLLIELERIGVNEMSIFPEAEHLCKYLKWREGLEKLT